MEVVDNRTNFRRNEIKLIATVAMFYMIIIIINSYFLSSHHHDTHSSSSFYFCIHLTLVIGIHLINFCFIIFPFDLNSFISLFSHYYKLLYLTDGIFHLSLIYFILFFLYLNLKILLYCS